MKSLKTSAKLSFSYMASDFDRLSLLYVKL